VPQPLNHFSTCLHIRGAEPQPRDMVFTGQPEGLQGSAIHFNSEFRRNDANSSLFLTMKTAGFVSTAC